jgi:pimeloyl-ACP methyl ester carboxylesterase
MSRCIGVAALLCVALGCAHGDGVSLLDPVIADPAPIDRAHPAFMTGVAVESGGSRLNGIVYVPQGAGPHPVVILLHGYPGEERNLDLAQAIRRAGWSVLFVHYRGAGGSEGNFSFANAIDDVAATVALVRAEEFAEPLRSDAARIALVGHSMGGFVALYAGSELAEVDCVASLAGANLGLLGRAAAGDPDQARAAAEQLDRWSGPIRGTSGEALVRELVDGAERFDTTRLGGPLAGKAVLLVGGTRDEVTPMDVHHRPLVAALRTANTTRLTDASLDTDHAFSDRRIALSRLVVSWLEEGCR